MPENISATKDIMVFNSELLFQLRAQGLISDEDVTILGNIKTGEDQAKRLSEILEARSKGKRFHDQEVVVQEEKQWMDRAHDVLIDNNNENAHEIEQDGSIPDAVSRESRELHDTHPNNSSTKILNISVAQLIFLSVVTSLVTTAMVYRVDLLYPKEAVLQQCPIPDAISECERTDWRGDSDFVDQIAICNCDTQCETCSPSSDGVDINSRDAFGNTKLHYASLFQDEKWVKELVLQGADLNVQNHNLETPLILASQGKDKEVALRIINHLIEKGADVHKKSRNGTFLHCLISFGSTSLSPSQFHNISEGLTSVDMYKVFTATGGTSRNTPLQEAMKHIEVGGPTLQLLHDNGINLNMVSEKESDSILAFALAGGRSVKLMSDLTSFGVFWSHKNKYGRNLLHIASQFSHLDGVKYFLTNTDLDVNAQDSFGDTPLHIVVKWGEKSVLEMARLLIENGANAHIKNEGGNSSVEHAYNRSDLVQELVGLLNPWNKIVVGVAWFIAWAFSVFAVFLVIAVLAEREKKAKSRK